MNALVSSDLSYVDSNIDVLSSFLSINARLPAEPVEDRLLRMARMADADFVRGFTYFMPYANSAATIGESTLSSTTAYRITIDFKSNALPLEARLSPLGRRFLARRRADIANGMVLLDEDEIAEEIARMRGKAR